MRRAPVLSRVLSRSVSAGTAASFAIGLAVTVVLAPSAADAAPPHTGEPIGSVEHVTGPTASAVEFVGWTADPNALTQNLSVVGLVDGSWKAGQTTAIARPWIAEHYHTGPTPGFDLTVPVPQDGLNHTVCLAARNVGAGLDRVLRCAFTPLGRTPSGTELAQHSPRGSIQTATITSGVLHLVGWATDPDYLGRRVELAMYLDGTWVVDGVTHAADGAQLPPGAGPRPWFDVSYPVTPGAHIGCVWLVNVGPGDNKPLGCRIRDTRGAGTGTQTPPPVNAQILAEAKRHIGQQYQWGAEGPDKFDCSGLVMYSYSKYHVSTPRVSSDQFHAARLITPAAAEPGDLVFYHDLYGDVYHVGIYISPGLTVAAIDTAEGVNYQHIWDPAVATYGSFTHA